MLGVVLALLAALVLLAWLSVSLFTRRLQRRRRAETESRRRVLAAWSEAVDVLDDVGVRRRQADTSEQLVSIGASRLGSEAGPP